MNKLLRCVICAGLVLLMPLAVAAPPQTINYQGYLTNPVGAAVNSAVVMTFRLYNAASGGAALYTETQLSVNVANGNFNAVLGSVSPITLPFDVPYWLTVAINADGEMSPRQPLASSPYAFRALTLDSAATVPGSQLAGDINATGNILLTNSTASAGNILKGASPFIHNFGSSNTFIGVGAGNFTMTGFYNTSNGVETLSNNTTGINNTASGLFALFKNTSGSYNTAIGVAALSNNTTASFNTASGEYALVSNTTGNNNNASGGNALAANTTGDNNNGSGMSALSSNTTGSFNTASGYRALSFNATGNNNTAIGFNAGLNLTTGDNNIDIGNTGLAGESNTIRIGTPGTQIATSIAGISGALSNGGVAVLVNTAGQLGTTLSSRRFKDDIADMDEASSALMKLRPVTFHYKSDHSPSGRTLQYGLIAEEVAEVYPSLVAHSADGQIETVMYQFLPPMLLSEYQKQQRTIQAQAAELAQQQVRLERLERELLGIRSLLDTR